MTVILEVAAIFALTVVSVSGLVAIVLWAAKHS